MLLWDAALAEYTVVCCFNASERRDKLNRGVSGGMCLLYPRDLFVLCIFIYSCLVNVILTYFHLIVTLSICISINLFELLVEGIVTRKKWTS